MVNFERGEYIKYYVGSNKIRSHIDAVHAVPPKAELFTGEIVERVITSINCNGIISTVSRTIADLNRLPNQQNEEAIKEYRSVIKDMLNRFHILDKNGKLTKPYLHLAIHGIKDTVHGPKVIEIGTLIGKTCSPEVKKWFADKLVGNGFELQIDTKMSGDISKKVHRWGDKVNDYLGYGENFNTFQIEISRTLREKHRNELIDIFSETIINFNETFK